MPVDACIFFSSLVQLGRRPTDESLNLAVTVSTKDIIANRANTPPRPSQSPGGVFAQICDIWFPATSSTGKSQKHDSGKTAHDWVVSTSVPTNPRLTM